MAIEGKLCPRCKKGKFRYDHTGIYGYNGLWSPLLRGEYDVYVCDSCGLRSYEKVKT